MNQATMELKGKRSYYACPVVDEIVLKVTTKTEVEGLYFNNYMVKSYRLQYLDRVSTAYLGVNTYRELGWESELIESRGNRIDVKGDELLFDLFQVMLSLGKLPDQLSTPGKEVTPSASGGKVVWNGIHFPDSLPRILNAMAEMDKSKDHEYQNLADAVRLIMAHGGKRILYYDMPMSRKHGTIPIKATWPRQEIASEAPGE